MARTKAILNTLAGFKRLKNHEKVNFKEAIRCLYQNSVEISKKNIGEDVLDKETFINFIPIDGKAS